MDGKNKNKKHLLDKEQQQSKAVIVLWQLHSDHTNKSEVATNATFNCNFPLTGYCFQLPMRMHLDLDNYQRPFWVTLLPAQQRPPIGAFVLHALLDLWLPQSDNITVPLFLVCCTFFIFYFLLYFLFFKSGFYYCFVLAFFIAKTDAHKNRLFNKFLIKKFSIFAFFLNKIKQRSKLMIKLLNCQGKTVDQIL